MSAARFFKLSEVSDHIDGWYELFDMYGGELEHAHNITRGMFLDILPKELKADILKKTKLRGSGHRVLADWCRVRCTVLQNDSLAQLQKRELQYVSGHGRKVHSVREEAAIKSPVPDAEIDSDLEDVPKWGKDIIAALQSITAVAPKKPTSGRKEEPR